MDTPGYWYNYDIQNWQLREAPQTSDDALPLIPDNQAARNLFKLYLSMGDGILQAMRKTLLACVGQSEKADVT